MINKRLCLRSKRIVLGLLGLALLLTSMADIALAAALLVFNKNIRANCAGCLNAGYRAIDDQVFRTVERVLY